MSTPSEKTDVQQKRQDLFSLWSGSNQVQEIELQRSQINIAQALPIERSQQSGPIDEVQRLIHRFSNPNADRMFLR